MNSLFKKANTQKAITKPESDSPMRRSTPSNKAAPNYAQVNRDAQDTEKSSSNTKNSVIMVRKKQRKNVAEAVLETEEQELVNSARVSTKDHPDKSGDKSPRDQSDSAKKRDFRKLPMRGPLSLPTL